MIALLDIGNSRVKYCIVSQQERSVIKSITNELLSHEYLSQCMSSVDKVIVASVSHSALTGNIELWCQANNICYQQVISEKNKNGVVSAYDLPTQLGVDRWLTLIGANELFPEQNSLIVDAGTATTIDVLSSNGEHQGGWILAGIETLFSCVLDNTSQVKANSEKAASLTFGKNSSENVNNATWAATVGAISLAVLQCEQQGIVIDNIILTGGNGRSLASLLTHPSTVVEELVFIGLQAYI